MLKIGNKSEILSEIEAGKNICIISDPNSIDEIREITKRLNPNISLRIIENPTEIVHIENKSQESIINHIVTFEECSIKKEQVVSLCS